MKHYLRLIGAVLFPVGIFGYLLPFLISAVDPVLPILALIVFIAFWPLEYFILRPYLEMLWNKPYNMDLDV